MTLSPIIAAMLEPADSAPPPPSRPRLPPSQAPFPARPSAVPSAPAHAPQRAPQRAPARPQQGARDNAAPQGMAERQGGGAAGGTALSLAACQPELGWEGQSGEGAAGDGQDELPAGGVAGGLDTEALLDLLPIGGDSGIFEVLLPGGESIGVVADVRNASASFLLTVGSDKLRVQLQQKRLELECGLKRRMGRPVRLAVL